MTKTKQSADNIAEAATGELTCVAQSLASDAELGDPAWAGQLPIQGTRLTRLERNLFREMMLMKSNGLMALGVCIALLGAAALADDGGKLATTSGDGDGSSTEQQAGAESGEASDASGSGTKRADTATAVGALYKGVKDGEIKIEGGTDPGAPGL